MTSFMKKLLGSTSSRQRGAIGGIPEQVIAIAVGVIVVSGMVALGSRAFTSSKVNTEIANLNSITNGARSLYSGMVNYTGIAADQLIAAGAVPTAMVDGSNVRNAWGGALTIGNDTTNAGFTITSAMYPQDVCIDLLTKTPSSGYYKVRVNNQVVVDLPNNSGSFPIAPGTAMSRCSSPSQNTIEWSAR